MGKKRKAERGFVKLRVVVYTQTMEIITMSVTGELVGDVTEFRSLPGRARTRPGRRAARTKPLTIPKIRGLTPGRGAGGRRRPRRPVCQNRLASGTTPLAPHQLDHLGGGDDGEPAAPDIVYGDAV